MTNDSTQAAGHVKAAIALAQLGKLDAAIHSLRTALGLEFDIELADAVGRLDGLPDGTVIDLASYLPSWHDELNADEDAFDIVVEGFEDARGSLERRGAHESFDDFGDLGDSRSAAAYDAQAVPTVPIDSADAARARAATLGRARYAGVAPPPPAHRRGLRNADEESGADESGFHSTPSRPGVAAEPEWRESTAEPANQVPETPARSAPTDGFGGFDDFDFGDGPSEPTDRLRWSEAVGGADAFELQHAEDVLEDIEGYPLELPQTGPRPAANAGDVTRPPGPSVPDWGEQPSVRKAPPTVEKVRAASEPDWMAPTPLPTPVVAEADRETPAMNPLDATPAPSYYDPLRDAPSQVANDSREAFGVVRNSSVRKARAADPASVVAAAPRANAEPVHRRVDEMLAEAVQHMRRGDLSLADSMIERVLEREPRNAEALNLRNGLRKQLANLRMRALEPLDRIPRQDLRAIMNSGNSLNPRRMFILSLVDGTMSLRDIVDLSGSAPDEASELLLSLVDEGLIVFR